MASTYSSNNEIIRTRVLNQIQLVKYGLSRQTEFDTYNDLLIIGKIVPKLPEGVLIEILQILKNMNDQLNSMPSPHTPNIHPLLEILAKAQGQVGDNLLNDFLNCSTFEMNLIAPKV